MITDRKIFFFLKVKKKGMYLYQWAKIGNSKRQLLPNF